jgi:hypothetical protein
MAELESEQEKLTAGRRVLSAEHELLRAKQESLDVDRYHFDRQERFGLAREKRGKKRIQKAFLGLDPIKAQQALKAEESPASIVNQMLMENPDLKSYALNNS